MATASLTAGVITGNQLVLDYLNRTYNEVIRFRNTSLSPKRQNLLHALQQAYQEAASCNLEPVSGCPPRSAVARSLLELPGGKALAAAVAENDLPGANPDERPNPGWLEGLFDYASSRRVNFPVHVNTREAVHRIPAAAAAPIRIAITGDRGTQKESTRAIAELISQQHPHYTIHLGDVYYSDRGKDRPQNPPASWPCGSLGSFALNSTNEMFSGGDDYFNVTLWSPTFAIQSHLSYFALYNPYWLIIGLDTSYFAYNYSLLYDEGTLDDPLDHTKGSVQVQWLRELLLNHAGKRVIVLTHHDGFSVDPVSGKVRPKPLWTQMASELRGRAEWWWYWGHIHAGIAYRRILFLDDTSVSPRCVGHGGVPHRPFPRELRNFTDPNIAIEWAEHQTAHSGESCRALNGFVMLTLDGPALTESFFDETGRQRWPRS